MQPHHPDTLSTQARATDTQVHRKAIKAPIPEIAAQLQELLGQKVVALVSGVHDPKAVGRWARGEREPHEETKVRLVNAYLVVQLLLTQEGPRTVRTWMLGMNPLLGDKAPASVLAENPDRVLAVAREFLAQE